LLLACFDSSALLLRLLLLLLIVVNSGMKLLSSTTAPIRSNTHLLGLSMVGDASATARDPTVNKTLLRT